MYVIYENNLFTAFALSPKCGRVPIQIPRHSAKRTSNRSKLDHKDQAYKLVAQTAAMQISAIQRLYCPLVITLDTDPAVTIYMCLFQIPLPWEKERIMNLSALHK